MCPFGCRGGAAYAAGCSNGLATALATGLSRPSWPPTPDLVWVRAREASVRPTVTRHIGDGKGQSWTQPLNPRATRQGEATNRRLPVALWTDAGGIVPYG